MPKSSSLQPAYTDARLYVRARWAFALVLAVLPPLGLGFARGPKMIWMYAILVGVLLADSAILSLRFRVGLDESIAAMRWVLFPDLICIAGFTYLLQGFEVGFYPVAALLASVYALVTPKSEARAAGAGVASAYLVGYALGHTSGFTVSGAVLHALSTAAILLLTLMVAASVDRRRAREEETRQAVESREEALTETRRRVAELQAVSQITETIHSSLDFERVGPLVLEILAKVIDIEACCLFVIDKEKSETLFSASFGAVAELPDGDTLAEAARTGDEHFSCMAPFDHADTMVLFCADADAIERLSEEDRLVLSAVASELVVAVENSRLYKLTKRLAITDELTGLANYRHLQSRIDREIERARRYEKHFSLLMLDVDDFKSFNDSQGHVAGDGALADLARVMEHAVREVDLVARYGGEEFSFVLPETDAAGAFVVAEKIRESVAEHLFPDAGGERGCRLTVSLGLATYPTNGTDREALLREADDALYRAKSGGKNRVRTPRYSPATLERVDGSEEPTEE